jgi:hypothetical protein
LEEIEAYQYLCASNGDCVHFRTLDEMNKRLHTIQTLLGDDEFAEAISQVKDRWEDRYSTFVNAREACKNNRGSMGHDHFVCLEELKEKVSPLAARWPDLNCEQARAIFERTPFIGMSIEQAEQAVGCLRFHGRWSEELLNKWKNGELEHEFGDWIEGENEIWEVSKQAWGTENRNLLMFIGGRLAAIKEITQDRSAE